MGAAISSSGAEIEDGGSIVSLSSSGPGLGDIPESCISFLLMSFDPQEICQLARVNKAFHRASSADFVWESKLPPTYKFLLNKVLGEENLVTITRKEIYTKLCRPNFIDGGTKEVWLDRCSGQVCLFISSKSFKITGIDDRRYWNYVPTEESRFTNVAYLQQMWWVEVLGEIEFEFPKGKYTLLSGFIWASPQRDWADACATWTKCMAGTSSPSDFNYPHLTASIHSPSVI